MVEDKPLFTAKDYIKYEARRRGVSESFFNVPSRLILVYQRLGFNYLRGALDGEDKEWLYKDRPVFVGKLNDKRIGVFRPWVGASGAAAMLEELIACGARKIIEVGVAGGLQPSVEVGDIVVVTDAFPDEGTSRHYFPSETRFGSSTSLRELFIQQLRLKGLKFSVGPVWSTDGFYRETRGKFLKFRQQGALAVNGETSALFAVAKYHGVNIASAQVISDILTEDGWLCAFGDKKVSDSLKALLNVAVQVLEKT